MKKVGTGTKIEEVTGLCILSQNIINEKIYLALWFWFVILYILWALQLIFEVAIFCIPTFRGTLITQQMGNLCDGEMKSFIERECDRGDWFLLYQIGKNTDKQYFYHFIERISRSSEVGSGKNSDLERGRLINHTDENNFELEEKS